MRSIYGELAPLGRGFQNSWEKTGVVPLYEKIKRQREWGFAGSTPPPTNGSKILKINLKLRSSHMPGTWLLWMSYVLVAGKNKELGRAVRSLGMSPLTKESHPMEVSDMQLSGQSLMGFLK